MSEERPHSIPVAVTGMGIISSIASTIPDFVEALRVGRCGVIDLNLPPEISVRTGAVLTNLPWRERFESVAAANPVIHRRGRKILNNTTDSTRWSACAALQAWLEGGLAEGEPGVEQTGLIIAGSNLSQAYSAENWSNFSQTGRFNPKYGISFFDTNQLGCLSEILGLRGMGWTVGAASASGNAAIFQAFHWIRAGLINRCLVVGAGLQLSGLELQAFRVLGAISGGKFASDPRKSCRPFDDDHEGFVPGEGSAALMLEARPAALARSARIWGEIAGASLVLDGNHGPDPSVEGETRAMRTALSDAGVAAAEIGYVNSHGTSSPLGDLTECSALHAVFEGARPFINSTKGLTGHCLSASGVIEAVAALLQLKEGFIHPNINLERPIDPVLRFAGGISQAHQAEYALSNGFGFGGINSSLVIRKARWP